MSTPRRPADPNPIFRDVIETARTVYAGMRFGQEAEIKCSKALLDRMEPEPAAHREGALGRVKEWAAKLRFGVTLSEMSSIDKEKGDKAEHLSASTKPITAQILTLKIKRLK